MPIEPPYEFIRDNLRRARIIPFLGAGASMQSRPSGAVWKSPDDPFLPTANELAEYLDRRSEFPSGESVELARVAQYFDGITGRGGLNDELHKIFARAYQPTALHKYFAGLPSNLLIVTTNYDDLLERAFIDEKRAFDLVVYNTGSQKIRYCEYKIDESQNKVVPGEFVEKVPNEFAPDLSRATVIYKMHGTFDLKDAAYDSYVITEDDYVEFLARMSSQTAVPAGFGEPFKKRHFLFLGYGLRDWNLRVLLYKIWKDYPRNQKYNSWAIQQKASELEREFWLKRDLRIFELSIEEFLKKLKQI